MTENTQSANHLLANPAARLLQQRNTLVENRNTDKRECSATPARISRSEVVHKMAARLASSFCRSIPAPQNKLTMHPQLKAVAVMMLKQGMEVDDVAERLTEMVKAREVK